MPAVAQNQNPPALPGVGANYCVRAADASTYAALLPASSYLGWVRPQRIGDVIDPTGSVAFTSFGAESGLLGECFNMNWGTSDASPLPDPPINNLSHRYIEFTWNWSGLFHPAYRRTSADNVYNVGSWYCLCITWDVVVPEARFYLGTETTRMVELAYDTTILPVPFGIAPGTTGAGICDGPNSADVPITVYPGVGPQIFLPGVITIAQMEAWRFRPRMLPGAIAYYDWGKAGADMTQPDYSGNGAPMQRGRPGATTLNVTEVPGPMIFSMLAGAAG